MLNPAPDDKGTDVKTVEDLDIEIDIGEADRKQLEKKLLRKIDLRLMPLMMVIYVLNYLDRNNIAVARFVQTTPLVTQLR